MLARYLNFGLMAILLALPLPGQTPAAVELPRKELTEKTSDALGKLRPLVDNKDYAGAIQLIERTLVDAAAGSFDLYLLLQLKTQILLAQNMLSDAIEPLETTLRMAQNNPNFADASGGADQLYMLAQLYYQQATEARGAEAQRPGYVRALDALNRWYESSTKVTVDSKLFGASLCYQLATLEPGKIDRNYLQQALKHARDGEMLVIVPPTQLIQILIACYLQLNEYEPASLLLEIAVNRDPKNASTWSQLLSIYMATAGESTDADEVKANSLRALYVLERAQANGFFSTPKDHYTRVAILFNLGQFTRAAALLEAGLKDGKLENNKRNWELLASAYQQTNQELKAADSMSRAADRFPEDGALEFSLAQFLYAIGKVEDAYQRGQSALAKGLDKRGPTQVYLAYLAFELQRLEEAQKWIAEARASGDAPETSVDPLDAAISEAIRQRETATRI